MDWAAVGFAYIPYIHTRSSLYVAITHIVIKPHVWFAVPFLTGSPCASGHSATKHITAPYRCTSSFPAPRAPPVNHHFCCLTQTYSSTRIGCQHRAWCSGYVPVPASLGRVASLPISWFYGLLMRDFTLHSSICCTTGCHYSCWLHYEPLCSRQYSCT